MGCFGSGGKRFLLNKFMCFFGPVIFVHFSDLWLTLLTNSHGLVVGDPNVPSHSQTEPCLQSEASARRCQCPCRLAH